MITLIDYGSSNAKELYEFIRVFEPGIIISSAEADILNSDKLILPDSDDIPQSVRALHLLNLFSVLRIIKKPLLGIGTGMHLMTESFADENMSCLGCFPVKCKRAENDKLLKGGIFKVKVLKKSHLLKHINSEAELYFKNSCIVPVNEFTTAIVENGDGFSAALEKENLYGILFNPVKSVDVGKKVIENFINL